MRIYKDDFMINDEGVKTLHKTKKLTVKINNETQS